MPRYLSPGGQQYRGDRGEAHPGLAELLAAYQAGQQSEQAVLTALSAARLLVPVVAVLAQGPQAAHSAQAAHDTDSAANDAERDKDSEMMLPRLIGRDGRPAVPAFTSIDALARWREDARPVPAEADRVWRAAVADECAVVIDVAGPVPLAVEGARLAALAAGRPVPPAHEDPDIRAAVQDVLAQETDIAGFALAPGQQADLAVVLRLAGHDARPAGPDARPAGPDARPAGPDALPAASRAAQRIAAVLASRMRRGIEFSVAVASSTPPPP